MSKWLVKEQATAMTTENSLASSTRQPSERRDDSGPPPLTGATPKPTKHEAANPPPLQSKNQRPVKMAHVVHVFGQSLRVLNEA